MTTPQIRQQLAHVFRRCGFGPKPGLVEAWEQRGPAALIDDLLANETINYRTQDDLYAGIELPAEEDNDYQLYDRVVAAMVADMIHGPNPLHERMTWYWHTHLTSSYEQASVRLMWRQHQLLREHALGHFPTLMREITTDAAMLLFLDGSGSRGTNPNENYAREMLELFTLGRNAGYGEDDVRAAARILAGWHVDWETSEVSYEPEQAYLRPVTFMGERRRWSVDDFVDFVCSQPACARHVATRMYHHLVGPDPTEQRIGELAAVFADGGMEIKPLVAAILQGPDFLTAINSRARQPLEWILGARQALGFDEVFTDDEFWWLEVLGQVPFLPPNVAGWPISDRWASASQMITRTSLMLDWELPEQVHDQVAPTVDAVLARCGIFDPSDSTFSALKKIEAEFSEYDGRLDLLFATALVSPEFSLL